VVLCMCGKLAANIITIIQTNPLLGSSMLRIGQGRYQEAELLAKRILKFIDEHQNCGPESPMAFGTRGIIIEAIWKQGRQSEANIYYLHTLQLIKKSKDSKFAKHA
jgi:hypothetical protein